MDIPGFYLVQHGIRLLPSISPSPPDIWTQITVAKHPSQSQHKMVITSCISVSYYTPMTEKVSAD